MLLIQIGSIQLFVQSNTLLLADVFENIQNK